jgi:hypothetical protein
VGGAAGCLASPVLLTILGAPLGILISAVPAVLLASPPLLRSRPARRALPAVPLALLALALLAPELHSVRRLNTMGEVHAPEYESFAVEAGDLEFERWALDAWTIIRSDRIPQQWKNFQGWGLSRRYQGPIPRIKLVNYNARFSTYVTEYDGNLAPLRDWLDSDLISLHYLLGRRFDSVLVIGAGGGREVLNALNHDARQVTAIDVSAVVIDDVMKDRLLEFSGGLYLDPRVTALAEEGRSFVERSPGDFDLIDFSIVGGMNLEKMDLVRVDDLFTREALATYAAKLAPDGVFSYVMYSLRSDLAGDLAARSHLTATPYVPALKTLAGLRMAFEATAPGIDFRRHVLIASLRGVLDPSYDLVHIIASRTPFRDAEREAFRRVVEALEFVPVHPPPPGADVNLYGRVLEAPNLHALSGSLPFSVLPATDDAPFSYAFDASHFRKAWDNGVPIRFLAGNPLLSLGVTVGLVALLVIVAPLLFLVLRGGRVPADLASTAPLLGLFACLGYGYMGVEIAVLLKLQLYLGKPIYGLSVALFAFLLSSGLGSRFTDRFVREQWSRVLHIGVAAVLLAGLLFSLGSGPLFAHTLSWPLAMRVLLSVAAIFPLAFAMGTFFPLGIKLISERSEDWIPWAWAINGCMSVVGIFGTRSAALFLGFDRSLVIGLFCYAVAALCVVAYRRATPAAVAS